MRFELSLSYIFLTSIHRECTTSQFDLTTDNFSLTSKSSVAEVKPWLLFLTASDLLDPLSKELCGMYMVYKGASAKVRTDRSCSITIKHWNLTPGLSRVPYFGWWNDYLYARLA